MTKVRIDPGVCGFITCAEAQAETNEDEEDIIHIKVSSGCESVRAMMSELGDTADAFACCLAKPGAGPFYDYAREHFPGHCACPVIAGITKAIEAESGLALPENAAIVFEKSDRY